MAITNARRERTADPAADELAQQLSEDLRKVDQAIREAVKNPTVRAKLKRLHQSKAKSEP